MKITAMTSSPDHPVCPRLEQWRAWHAAKHDIQIKIGMPGGFPGGDILFLICCSDIIPTETRTLYKHTLLVHASDLPEGRGWSPVIWQVLEGRKKIMVTLLEAEDKVDTGHIWLQKPFTLEGHELYDEINKKHHDATLELMTEAIERYGEIKPRPQAVEGASYYPKRTPGDSRLDPDKSIAEQMGLLRVADPERYPAFFELDGRKYFISVRKA